MNGANEFAHPIVFVQFHVAGRGAHEPAVEHAAGQLVKLVVLQSLKMTEVDLGGAGQLGESHSP